MGFAAMKGLAGEVKGAADLVKANANPLWYWWDHTDIVRENGRPIGGQCGNVKGERGNSWDHWNKAEIQQGARNFQYLLIGNEWEAQGYSYQAQAYMLNCAIRWAKDPVNGNPNVRIVAPNSSCYAGFQSPMYIGTESINRIAAEYNKRYSPPLQNEIYAVGVHHYYDYGWSNFTGMIRRAQNYANRFKPGIPVWLTEWGCFNDTWKAFQAMQVMRDYVIPRGLVRAYFYYHTYYWKAEHKAYLFNANRSLTTSGQRYKTTLPPGGALPPV